MNCWKLWSSSFYSNQFGFRILFSSFTTSFFYLLIVSVLLLTYSTIPFSWAFIKKVFKSQVSHSAIAKELRSFETSTFLRSMTEKRSLWERWLLLPWITIRGICLNFCATCTALNRGAMTQQTSFSLMLFKLLTDFEAVSYLGPSAKHPATNGDQLMVKWYGV